MGHGEGLIPVRKAGACVADVAVRVGTYTPRRFHLFIYFSFLSFIEEEGKCAVSAAVDTRS